jgi:hypothetical protein
MFIKKKQKQKLVENKLETIIPHAPPFAYQKHSPIFFCLQTRFFFTHVNLFSRSSIWQMALTSKVEEMNLYELIFISLFSHRS